jgi:Mrp family chromosome partitioning ATPase
MRLARDVAGAGRRVVVVNTGFVEDQAGDDEENVGLAGLLAGDAAFEAVIQRDKFSRVHAIAAGRTAADPLMLLASDRMETVIKALRQTYDVVILVAPAVIRRGEARLLAAKVDYVVLLSMAPAGEPTSRRARDRLVDAGAQDVEFVRLETIGPNPSQSAA